MCISHMITNKAYNYVLRAGLVHIVKGSPGAPFPSTLTSIQPSFAAVELHSSSVHGMYANICNSEMDMALKCMFSLQVDAYAPVMIPECCMEGFYATTNFISTFKSLWRSTFLRWYFQFPYCRSWLIQRSSVTGSSLISTISLWIKGTSVQVAFSDGMWFGYVAGSNSDLHSLNYMLSDIGSWLFWYFLCILY